MIHGTCFCEWRISGLLRVRTDDELRIEDEVGFQNSISGIEKFSFIF